MSDPNAVLQEMLEAVPDTYQKTVGFPTWDWLAAASIPMARTDAELAEAKRQLDPANLTGEALDAYIFPRTGQQRTAATYAEGLLTATGNGTIPAGALFESGGGVQFVATETVVIAGSGTVPIRCVTPGAVGNLPAGSVTMMPVQIAGIVSVTNQSPTAEGYEAETDESYYQRFLLRLQTPPTSGNQYHYLEWAMEISGVGGVLSFLPQIALLFFFLSFLEDSGYMSRAAFIMDRLLRRFGLSGKAFIPMLMGFGCSVPAIMGARTMENEKDRRMTILLIPFMSCSAKLPVYGLLSAAFFGPWAGLVVFGLYVIGMAVGILSGIFFKHTLFAGEPAPFVLELPPYRFPSIENIATHVWQKVKGFLVKAGTLILAMSIVLWLLQSFDFSLHMVDDAANSMLGTLGALIAPVFAPLGFGFWQAAVALLTGFIAKEMVVSSLSMFYGFSLPAAGTAVAAAMTGFTPLSAFSMLVFILLYVPCVAATSTMAKELGSAKWTVFSVCWQIGVAYVVSLLVHTVGLALGFV